MLFYPAFLFMFFSLTALSVYMGFMHQGNRLVKWASIMILCGGLLGLQMLLEKGWIPYAVSHGVDRTVLEVLSIAMALLNVAISTVPYWCALVFYLLYNGYLNRQRWIPLILSAPIWITAAIADLPANHIDSGFVAVWGLCYLCITSGLAVRSIVKGKSHRERLNHALIAVIFLTPITIANIYQFVDKPLSERLMTIIPYVCIVCLLFISVMYLRDAFLGIKRKSMHTVHVGTGLIHHSLKNSIGKIKLNALNIRKNLQSGQYEQAETYIDQLLKTHEAMMGTMSQISHVVSNKLDICKERIDLSKILDEVTASLEAYPNVRIERLYYPVVIEADRRLIVECIQNICNNAADAMKGEGVIRIRLERKKRKLILVIGDTGRGMDGIQLQNVFEPFYSTKQRSGKHFGLGMYQVKKVMDVHKGKIEIKSAPDRGTTIYLIFKLTSR
jgi:signal transduction histidine kinase